MTTTERAVRKASRERLLRDFARAAADVQSVLQMSGNRAEWLLDTARIQTSRTRYACLMTAFGQ